MLTSSPKLFTMRISSEGSRCRYVHSYSTHTNTDTHMVILIHLTFVLLVDCVARLLSVSVMLGLLPTMRFLCKVAPYLKSYHFLIHTLYNSKLFLLKMKHCPYYLPDPPPLLRNQTRYGPLHLHPHSSYLRPTCDQNTWSLSTHVWVLATCCTGKHVSLSSRILHRVFPSA